MQFIRQVYDDLPDFIPIPAALKHSKAEVIILPLNSNDSLETETVDALQKQQKLQAFFDFLNQNTVAVKKVDIPDREARNAR